MEIKLTKRETEVVKLMSTGKKSSEIATELGISTRTIDAHRQNIMSKLGVKNAISVLRVCYAEGILSIND